MGFNVVFIGIINFFDLDPQGRLVLIPDGRNQPPIDPHFARILVEDQRLGDASGWWPKVQDPALAQRHIQEFRVEEPSRLTVTGFGSDKTFDDRLFEAAAIRLKEEAADQIDIVPGLAKTIAQIPIRGGVLASRRFRMSFAAELTVASHRGPIVIEALTWRGETKRLELKSGSQVRRGGGNPDAAAFVIANTSDSTEEHEEPEKSHFRLYGLLDSKQRLDLFSDPSEARENDVANLPEVQAPHAWLDYVRNELLAGASPRLQCSVTGCCSALECS